MTRAKDISKILTDANISGTLDVSGAFTSQGIDDNADATAITITSDEKVGINASSPARQFTVQNTIANSGGELGILSSDSSTTGAFGTIHFGNNTDTSLASIRAKADGSTTSGKLEFNTEPNGGAIETRMTIDSSGNVGIGTSSPSNLLSLDASGTVTTRYTSTGSAFSLLQVDNTGSMTFSADHGNNVSNSNIIFASDGGTERMRIDSSGDLLLGQTSTYGGIINVTFTSSDNGLVFTPTSNGVTVVKFHNSGVSMVGSIASTVNSVVYNTSSDYRLKESVTYDFDATTRLKQLKPCRFNFIADADTTVDGFLAHEVSSIVPEAITGEKDAVDADGKIDPQGIDQSKLVPLLVKTIQELEARIVALETA